MRPLLHGRVRPFLLRASVSFYLAGHAKTLRLHVRHGAATENAEGCRGAGPSARRQAKLDGNVGQLVLRVFVRCFVFRPSCVLHVTSRGRHEVPRRLKEGFGTRSALKGEAEACAPHERSPRLLKLTLFVIVVPGEILFEAVCVATFVNGKRSYRSVALVEKPVSFGSAFIRQLWSVARFGVIGALFIDAFGSFSTALKCLLDWFRGEIKRQTQRRETRPL